MKKTILIIALIILFSISITSPIVFGTEFGFDGKEKTIEKYNLNSFHISEILKSGQDYILKEINNCKLLDIEKTIIPPQQTLILEDPQNSPWPMYCHDTRHTGRSPFSTANTDSDEKWNLQLDGFLWGSPVIDDDGIIYVGSYDFYAIYPNGKIKWQIDDTQGVFSSAGAIDENGILYVGSIWASPNYFYAIDTNNGDLKWRRQISNHIYSSPVIGDDDTIYFGSSNENIYAYYPNGTLRWKHKTGNAVLSSPAIGNDGTVYCGSHDSNLYAFHPNNGTVKWKYKTGNWIRTAPCIGDDGTIYVVSLDNNLHAVNPDGTLKWKTNVGAGTSPTIGQDGIIYCGYDKLHAVNPSDGSIKWNIPVSGKIRGSTPCNSIDGTIYLGTDSGWIYAINPDGTEKWRKSIGGDVESAPAIGEDGTIYIGDGKDDGILHAFGPLDPNAPTAPEIDGPRLCIPGINYKYKFTSTSPIGNKVYYLVEWGDGTVTGWSGTYESGETITFYHKWSTPGGFTIKARAKDTDNLWGPWSELNVNKPRTRILSYPSLIGHFPMLEKLLSKSLFYFK